jgi:hypothetical protein
MTVRLCPASLLQTGTQHKSQAEAVSSTPDSPAGAAAAPPPRKRPRHSRAPTDEVVVLGDSPPVVGRAAPGPGAAGGRPEVPPRGGAHRHRPSRDASRGGGGPPGVDEDEALARRCVLVWKGALAPVLCYRPFPLPTPCFMIHLTSCSVPLSQAVRGGGAEREPSVRGCSTGNSSGDAARARRRLLPLPARCRPHHWRRWRRWRGASAPPPVPTCGWRWALHGRGR